MKQVSFISIFYLFFIFSTSIAAKSEGISTSTLEQLKASYERPTTIQFPNFAPYNLQIATLGKMLFFDPRLSSSQNMSCATCHNPSFGWETPVDKAIGNLNTPLDRHAPTVLNLAEAQHFMWDGRMNTLESQAMGPITNPVEMGSNFPDLIERLNSIGSYKKWFEQNFPEVGITRDTILRSIATYERTIQSGTAPFDNWLNGQEDAISEEAKQGFLLFNGKFGCASCHSGWSFTDHSFHDIGIITDDIGRGKIDKTSVKMQFAFKTSGLRNISARAPYMHNGSLETLEGVVSHYISGGVRRASISQFIKPIETSEAEKKALISFLESLTESSQDVQTPTLPSQ